MRQWIKDYFEHVEEAENQDIAVEIIFQCGDKAFWEQHENDRDKVCCVYRYTLTMLQKLLPDFKVANAVIHFDERIGENLKSYRRGDYIRLLLDGGLNEYLHGIDEQCYEMMDRLVEQMKLRAGITEEREAADQMKWVGLMNNVWSAAEEIALKEFVYV